MPRRLLPSLALVALAALAALAGCAAARAEESAAPAPRHYDETWESLSQHPVPEWFADAKFGIYAHWGVYSVPAFGNEWYPRNMYRKGDKTRQHHVETYGEKFGYKDFIPKFTAEKFDAEAWADLYAAAGAKFAGPVAEHHDGFSMWASTVNRWNAKAMGPKRDVVGELVAAIRKRGLKTVTSFHHAYNFQGYYERLEGSDVTDPAYEDFYGQLDPAVAHERWLKKLQEVIDAYQPDQIWFDFGLGKIPDDYKRRMAAYYYNKEAEWKKGVIITRKNDYLPEGVGVLDIERGKMDKPADFLWQTDDSVAVNSWCWVRNLNLKPTEELVHELIDIVAKNGVLLLNVCPKADGTIPEDQETQLRAMGAWLRTCGEAIYATRPWLVHGEGPNLFDPGRGFHREQVPFTSDDIRYTRSKDGRTLYAILLGWPKGAVTLQSVKVDSAAADARVTLLGHDKPLECKVDAAGRPVIRLPDLAPDARPCAYAWALRLEGYQTSLHPDARYTLPGAATLEADKAVLEGDKIKTEKKADRTAVGFWDNPAERIHWLVRIERPGAYAVRVEAASTAASALALDAEGRTTAAEVKATGGFDKPRFTDLGRLEFDKAGVYHVVLRPADPQAWKPVNVWKVQLAPAP
jgi:alpha-L-fucosidase